MNNYQKQRPTNNDSNSYDNKSTTISLLKKNQTITGILKFFSAAIILCLTFLPEFLFAQASWNRDFMYQELNRRPQLEVAYTDTHRDAFVISAESYRLTGDLVKPNLLYDTNTKDPWLWFEMTDKQGKKYSTRNTNQKSRINLYRRGAYFCEIHWFDIKFASETGEDLPVRTEVVLYCFPDKIRGSVKLHPSDRADVATFVSKGIKPATFDIQPIENEIPQYFNFNLMGDEIPLGKESLITVNATSPLRYDSRKGVYRIGSETAQGFQRHYFDSPNGYEEVTFKIKNDGTPRKIYICHETLVGEGSVEGGAVLDENGHPLPLLVQVSKNFGGEKEEKFYNPRDTAFSETFFPLYLEPYEEVNLSSLHLYQNWGRHMTKHWSSLGFFMDYFHTSTGVTETTCYIPFKFGHKTGIMVGDFRAMSQETFWEGQPQHDNIAGHNFLTYFDGRNWNYSEYQGTTYKSTGNNWCNVEMNYLSSDSAIRFSLDIWEVPQDDELRSFFTATYKIVKPLRIENARENFRFLDISTTQQRLRYKKYAYTALNGKVITRKINFGDSPFCARGIEIPAFNAFAAVMGEEKGSNGIMIRHFDANNGLKPAFSIQHKTVIEEPRDTTVNEHKVYTPPFKPGDIRFSLVPATDLLILKPGDEIVLSGFWLPYGEVNGAKTPEREIRLYGNRQPEITAISTGDFLNTLPVTLRVKENQAQFKMKGGFNIVPVIAKGFTDFRNPEIFRNLNGEWVPVYMNQNTRYDGNQVFCDDDGKFGAVFLVRTNGEEQEFLIRSGQPAPVPDKLKITAAGGNSAAVIMGESEGKNSYRLTINQDLQYRDAPVWKKSDGNSLWFSGVTENMRSGARVTGFEDYATIQCWWQPHPEKDSLYTPEINLQPDVKEGNYSLMVYQDGLLKPFVTENPFSVELKKSNYGIVILHNPMTDESVGLGFKEAARITLKEDNSLSIYMDEQRCPSNRRKVYQGYFFSKKGSPDVLLELIKQEIPVME